MKNYGNTITFLYYNVLLRKFWDYEEPLIYSLALRGRPIRPPFNPPQIQHLLIIFYLTSSLNNFNLSLLYFIVIFHLENFLPCFFLTWRFHI